MNQIQVLTLEDTERLLGMKEVISRIEGVYSEKANCTAAVWPMVFYEFEPGVADMDIKSGYLKEQGIFGLKLVSWFANNPAKGLPALTGAVMLFDGLTGKPLGLINGEHMTGMRTGAAGAVGIKYLARKNSETLLMVGTGHQAAFQITAALTVAENLKRVLVYNPRDFNKATTFCENFELKCADYQHHTAEILKARGIVLEAVSDLQAAVGISDIIVTVTPSRASMIKKEWVRPGTHFNCIGSDMSGKQEIDELIMGIARVFVDDIPQAIAVGEIEMAINTQVITKEDIVGEIGEVIIGKKIGRVHDTDITLFDSTGIGLQDLAIGALALQKAAMTAKQDNIGARVAF